MSAPPNGTLIPVNSAAACLGDGDGDGVMWAGVSVVGGVLVGGVVGVVGAGGGVGVGGGRHVPSWLGLINMRPGATVKHIAPFQVAAGENDFP